MIFSRLVSGAPLPQGAAQPASPDHLGRYWNQPVQELLARLGSGPEGLPSGAVAARQAVYGLNTIRAREEVTPVGLALNQFRSPLVLVLILAALVSVGVGEVTDAVIVLAVVLGSTVLGFVQEYRATSAVARLRAQVTVNATVLRDGAPRQLPAAQVVPGDLVVLSAGSLVPADGVLLAATDCFVNQAALTGETFPAAKQPGIVPAEASLAQRTNCVFMGTSVGSGTATMLVVQTGRSTVFGGIAQRLGLRAPETDFERGIRRFGYLLTQVMLVMVILVLSANLYFQRPAMDSLLFALALAVGLTPELLPAIVSITLAHGAQAMARRGVIVRRLATIENLGSMDVLCTDKTGTLTEGVVRLDEILDPQGAPSPALLRFAALNASLQSGLENPLDRAIVARAAADGVDLAGAIRMAEIPYDFVRKRLSIVTADRQGIRTLITKGALDGILDICTEVAEAGAAVPLDDSRRTAIAARFSGWSAQGFRVLGLATRALGDGADLSRAAETGMRFQGFLLFFDPPRGDVRHVIAELAGRGVQLKIITGDNRLVARHVAETVGLPVEALLTGGELADLGDDALWHLAERTTLFAEVDPNQKERIILALRRSGHVVGYMGDGINDAPALHTADVGISVAGAVDVAREAADIVLLRADLGVLLRGIDEGRRTFANTMKYILTTISANFGNMCSMAVASLVLPFLPLLAPQILLNNFLSDVPAATIATDNVDADMVERPRRWDTRFIRRYMVLFGLVSSLVDLTTFALLLGLFRATPDEFRTGWFVESLLTELVIALVIRTRHRFFRSRPGTLLLWSTVAMACVALVLPYLPASRVFGFVPLPLSLLAAVAGLTLAYVAMTEIAKHLFYRRDAAPTTAL